MHIYMPDTAYFTVTQLVIEYSLDVARIGVYEFKTLKWKL